MKRFIEIEYGKMGQPRPYADSIYEAYITNYSTGTLTDGSTIFHPIKEDEAKEIARKEVRGFVDNPEWHEAKLITCKPVGLTAEQKKLVNPQWLDSDNTKRWYVRITEAYCG